MIDRMNVDSSFLFFYQLACFFQFFSCLLYSAMLHKSKNIKEFQKSNLPIRKRKEAKENGYVIFFSIFILGMNEKELID